MSKPTPDQLAAEAEGIARKFSRCMVLAYTESCRRNAKYYNQLPNDDDFFAWLEGYDWDCSTSNGGANRDL